MAAEAAEEEGVAAAHRSPPGREAAAGPSAAKVQENCPRMEQWDCWELMP